MEEILASIRRIIADEADPASSTAKASPAAPAAKPAAAPAAPSPPPPAPRQQAAPKPAAPPPPAPKPAAPAQPAAAKQDDIDAILSAIGEGEAPDQPDVLELTEPVKGFKQIDAEDVIFREESEVRMQPSPAPQRMAAAPAAPASVPAPTLRQIAPSLADDDLLSPGATAAVNAAFGSLASTILSGQARTLEDLVQEMMRPMLKEWLDENLPGLVERMVRAEIERVSRGGR